MVSRVISLLAWLMIVLSTRLSAQSTPQTDSLIKSIINDKPLTGLQDAGTTLILSGDFSAAASFYNQEISKDEGDKTAYFNRGVVHWVTSDTLNACRDWSALLALGDTAAFKLLDSKCHGSMTIDDDVLPKATYHRLFTTEKDNRTASLNTKARTYVDEMPEFPGGTPALIRYLSQSIKYPAAAREKKTSGTVYVNFIVSSKGKILFPYVVRGIGSGCDEEALRVVRNMPAWKPGKQKGKPVLVRETLPVQFHLP